MTTPENTAHTRRSRRGPIAVAALAVATAAAAFSVALHPPIENIVFTTDAPASLTVEESEDEELEGMDERVKPSTRPRVDAAFERESYAAGARARLSVLDRAASVSVQLFRAGRERTTLTARDIMLGEPVSRVRRIGDVPGSRVVTLRVGNWPSGVYFARLTAPGNRVGFAPFILRPRRLGAHRVAVVLPTQTWQAYNFRDDDGNGKPNTWYAGGSTARLGRPFSDTRGVPPNYKYYDEPFLRWLSSTGREADYLSDADLVGARSGRQLARAYSLIIFPGHHEYITAHEYDVIVDYRNRGGNLAFLSANNFFWKITRRGTLMTRIRRWRELGRPEAALIGVQYFHNDAGQHRGDFVVRKPIGWLFDGTGLERGSRFANAGIEADRTYPSSPRNVQVVAEIPNLYGAGLTAQMTYYERGGAKVFAAGAFTLAGGVWWPGVRELVANLWTRLGSDNDTGPTAAPPAA